MCGRFTQYRTVAEYTQALQSDLPIEGGSDPAPIGRYNVAPSSKVYLLRGAEESIRLEAVRWGWAPHWAKGKMPPAINARVETVASGKFFKAIWPNRALVFADGWYEWLKDPADPKKKQPYYIRLKTDEPMFFAALYQSTPGLEPGEGDGFTIITAAASGGMVDIHDRRPVVLAPELAREWIDADLEPARAEEIVRDLSMGPEEFEWYPVGKAVGSPKNQGPDLIKPI